MVRPRPFKVLFSPSTLEYRALPQTAAEYTSSDAPLYAATPSPTRGYVTSTAATPITEEQQDTTQGNGPTNFPPSSYYSVSTPANGVNHHLVPHPTQYAHS